MKICPKCDTPHNKPGTFCSRSCANSRGPRSEEFKKAVSKKLSNRKLSETTIKKLSGNNHYSRKGKNLPELIKAEEKEFVCLFCQNKFKAKVRKDRKYCSTPCHNNAQKEHASAARKYYNACKFKFNTYDYPDYFNNSLFEIYGRYSAF